MDAPMLWEFVLTAACLCLVSVAMVSAAAFDVMSREVGDAHWKFVTAVGIPCAFLLGAEQFGILPAALVSTSLVFMAFHVLSDAIPGMLSLVASAVFAVLSLFSSIDNPVVVAPFASSALFLAMYHVRLLAGGADAKALIALSTIPQYPSLRGLPFLWQAHGPLSLVPLSVSVLIVAVILSLVPMVLLGLRNASKGFVGRRMFTEYRMPLEKARTSFVWLAEDVEDGEVVHRRVMDDETEAYERLEEAGIEDVAVTPMVPFVLYIAAGLLTVVLLGNPLFAAM